MPRRNRSTPWGDQSPRVARPWTGNRGRWQWICCRLEWKGDRQPVDEPHRWKPAFFTDEACALGALVAVRRTTGCAMLLEVTGLAGKVFDAEGAATV